MTIFLLRASLLCEMERRMIASRNANIDSGNPKIKLVEIPATDLLKETALSHQSETKV